MREVNCLCAERAGRTCEKQEDCVCGPVASENMREHMEKIQTNHNTTRLPPKPQYVPPPMSNTNSQAQRGRDPAPSAFSIYPGSPRSDPTWVIEFRNLTEAQARAAIMAVSAVGKKQGRDYSDTQKALLYDVFLLGG